MVGGDRREAAQSPAAAARGSPATCGGNSPAPSARARRSAASAGACAHTTHTPRTGRSGTERDGARGKAGTGRQRGRPLSRRGTVLVSLLGDVRTMDDGRVPIRRRLPDDSTTRQHSNCSLPHRLIYHHHLPHIRSKDDYLLRASQEGEVRRGCWSCLGSPTPADHAYSDCTTPHILHSPTPMSRSTIVASILATFSRPPRE